MIWIKYLITATTMLSLMLAGCSSNKVVKQHIHPAIQLARQHKPNIHAMNEFKLLDQSNQFGPYAQQVQLDLIYSYYKESNLQLAQAAIERFLRLNPTNIHVDYVLYMRGLTNMALDENALHIFWGVDRSDRNPEHARAALLDFTQLISGYPRSKYAMDATKRMLYLKNRLACHELAVVSYYNKRRAYIAVANRVEQMLHNFPDTQATRQALPYMETAYRELQLSDQADKIAEIIAKW